MKFNEAANKNCLFSQVFSIPKMIQNRIPKIFLFWKWFGTEFRGFFSSEKWFGTEFRGFSLPWNRRKSDGTAVCSVLFCIPRKKFLSENGNPSPPIWIFMSICEEILFWACYSLCHSGLLILEPIIWFYFDLKAVLLSFVFFLGNHEMQI